jgi:hypothetical protein
MDERNENLEEIDNVEIEPLTDKDLESVAGGGIAEELSCSHDHCSNAAAT